MGKSSAPTPPPAPTSQEISAANVESAKGLSRLQRAMQFGEPLLKEGYRAINVDRPSAGSQPLYETQTINLGTTYPSQIRYSSGGRGEVTHGIDIHGVILDGPHEGQSYRDVSVALNAVESEDDGDGGFVDGSEVPATQEVRQLTGWELEDGTVQDVAYLDAEGNTVDRNIAIEADFTGLGDTDLARQQWEFEKETSPERTQFLLDQMKQFGPEFTEQARALVERSDPTGFAARELLGQLAQEYQPAEVPVGPEMQEMGEFAAAERSGDAPTLERLEDIPEIVADAESMAGRRFAERDLIERAQSGRAGDLMAEEASRLARGRQAATGNIFGGGAVLDESRAVRQAEEQGQRQSISDLLGFLSSGQSAGDAEGRIAQQNLMNRLMGIEQRTGAEQSEFGMGQQVLSQRNQAADTDFARKQAAMGQRNQARQQAFNNAMQQTATQQQMQQQQMANLQSFSGLAPVSGQFGGLAGAQQAGAANFNPMQYTPTSGMQLLQGQQGLASNIFGTQANIWGQQAQIAAQPSGFGSLLGTVAGGFAGGAGASWGASKWPGK
jgi:hypothetical protein